VRPSRGTAVAIALFLAALAAAGCGLGPGEGVGEVSLTVTRDFGRTPLSPALREEVVESDTVMRVLERNAEIETRYGGGFVQAVDGLEADRRDGRYWDWLYYVNGVEAGVGAAEYGLRGGEAIWWDYRDWSAALRVPAVVGSWPQPFRDGYEGRDAPTRLECFGDTTFCLFVRSRLKSAGASLVGESAEGAIRVLAGPWAWVRHDPAAAQIEDGPRVSGVFAELEARGGRYVMWGLDETGERARAFGADAGLVAATRRSGGAPVWVVSGVSRAGERAAARALDGATLHGRYAVATEGARETPLPLR